MSNETGSQDGGTQSSERSPLLGARYREVLALAARDPRAAASIEELATVKTGCYGASPLSAPNAMSVVVWNLQRGRSLESWMAVDALRAADVIVACEVDDGMARSGNLDVAATLAERMGRHYAFAPSYLELTRGTLRERLATRALHNRTGFVGNAVISRFALRNVRRVPLPSVYDWYHNAERRVGTRVALLCDVEIAHRAVTIGAVHLEVFATPEQRAVQMRALLAALPGDGAHPTLLAGDFNTLGVNPSWRGAGHLLARRVLGGTAFGVVQHEPLFRCVEQCGFEWTSANVDAFTWGFPNPCPLIRAKLDWAFTRKLAVEPASGGVLEPAVRGRRMARLSDHRGLTLRVQPA